MSAENAAAILAEHPSDARAHHLAGVALSGLGRLDEAVDHLERAVFLAPQRARFRYDLGVAYLSGGRVADARGQFEAALEALPVFLYALNNLLVCYIELNYFAAAYFAAAMLSVQDRDGRNGDYARAVRGRLGTTPSPQLGLIARIQEAFSLECSRDYEEARRLYAECRQRLPEGDPAYWVLSAYLSKCDFLLGEYYQSYRGYKQARAGLRCVDALVTGLSRSGVIEPGDDQDVKRSYALAVERATGLSNCGLIATVLHTGYPPSLTFGCGDRTFEVSRAGNLFRVRDEGGGQVEVLLWEDELHAPLDSR